jgi:hypothetical protein
MMLQSSIFHADIRLDLKAFPATNAPAYLPKVSELRVLSLLVVAEKFVQGQTL